MQYASTWTYVKLGTLLSTSPGNGKKQPYFLCECYVRGFCFRQIRMHGAESRAANENSAYVFLTFNTCLSLLFPILVRSLVLYVVLALIFSILFHIIFSLYEVVVLFCICRFRTSFPCFFLSGVVFVLCLSLLSVHFPYFNQYLLLPYLLLCVRPILSE